MASTAHGVSMTQSSLRMQLRDYDNVSFDPAIHCRITVSTLAKAPEAAITSQFSLHNQDLIDVMADAIIQLLDNIGKARYSEPGSIIHMQSPTFTRAKRWIAGWEADGMLSQSDFRMTLAPAGEIFELEYYEHYFSTTLLTGSKVWLAFPLLQRNLDLLRKTYNDIHTTATLKVPVDILGKMQHGIIIIQKPVQTLVVPPYWSLMTFCISTSTSCGVFLATASAFMLRIKHMDLWITLNLFWNTPLQQQSHYIDYATELASHFSNIMTGSLKRFKVNPVQSDICQEWDKTAPLKDKDYENMKEKISGLLSLIENVEATERIGEMFRKAWIGFLEEKRKKRPECRVPTVLYAHSDHARRGRLE